MVLSALCFLQSSFVRHITSPPLSAALEPAGCSCSLDFFSRIPSQEGNLAEEWNFPVKRGKEKKTSDVNLDTAFVI